MSEPENSLRMRTASVSRSIWPFRRATIKRNRPSSPKGVEKDIKVIFLDQRNADESNPQSDQEPPKSPLASPTTEMRTSYEIPNNSSPGPVLTSSAEIAQDSGNPGYTNYYAPDHPFAAHAIDPVPVSVTNNVATIQARSGDTHLYYQDPDSNDILQIVATNAWTTGHYRRREVIIPGRDVLHSTPIAVSMNGDETMPFKKIHLYFFSTEYALRDYIWDIHLGWRNGFDCPESLVHQQFMGIPGSNVLYALTDQDGDTQRVGFVSALWPYSISEAVNDGSGWRLAPLSY